MRRETAICLMLVLASCATNSDLPSGAVAAQSFPAPQANGQLPPYRIGAFDKIAVTVFQEEDLSVRDVQVDSGGNVLLPLIGQIAAVGKTSTEFAQEIEQRLGARYLEHPQVSVIVQESVSQKVTVEGSVIEPGVYEIRGQTTLLDAIAMAKGTSRVAALGQVAIFREINGQRMGALFNVADIGKGKGADPEILGNDTVVVGLSNIKALWRDVLTAAPLLSVFRPFG